MCLTPSLDASQVVPQKKLTQHKAKIGNPIKLAFALIAVFIFDVNLQIGFNKRIVQHGLCIASQNEFFYRNLGVVKLWQR